MVFSNEWWKLKYYDPKDILVGLRHVECNYPVKQFPYHVRALRTNKLRKEGESRQCALFCYGMSAALNIEIKFARFESMDFDFIAFTPPNEFVPIQMKELVPEELNPESSIEVEIQKLTKYVDSGDLCVAMYLNRTTSLDLSKVEIPKLNIAELWLFGSISPDQSRWQLIGNILDRPQKYEFEYPGYLTSHIWTPPASGQRRT